jgi:type I restriction enzyme S subunit
MDQLTNLITSGPRHWSEYYNKGNGIFLMAQNVRLGELDLSYRQPVDPPQDDSSRERSQVKKGDLLVTIVGANTGDVCQVPRELPNHYICQSIALMRPVKIELSDFITMYLMSPENGQRQYQRYIYGAGRPHLKFDELRMTAVMVPPLAEQRRIVEEVERRLSVVSALDAAIQANLRRAGRLRQSILKRAFEGRLVPQDPNDEPASVLLERIRAGREADKPRHRTGRKTQRDQQNQEKKTPRQLELL